MGQDMLARLNELPRIQPLLQELLEMVNHDEVDFFQLAKKISIDQVLTARVLRMANSAHFGGGRNVSSVNDALIRIGIGAVKTLVVSSVLSSAFNNVRTLDLTHYWSDTFEVSVIASQIASETGMDANQAFTLAVLHNVGELMIHSLVPDEAQIIENQVKQGVDPFVVQESILHTNSAQLGGRLARSWKFPDEMADSIEHFHEPMAATVNRKMATLLHFARDINQSWDQLSEDSEKIQYLAEHPDGQALHIDGHLASMIDAHRGEGRDLASQMAS